jgi:hypothetical protein
MNSDKYNKQHKICVEDGTCVFCDGIPSKCKINNGFCDYNSHCPKVNIKPDHVHDFRLVNSSSVSSTADMVMIRCTICDKCRVAYIGSGDGCFPSLELYVADVKKIT